MTNYTKSQLISRFSARYEDESNKAIVVNTLEKLLGTESEVRIHLADFQGNSVIVARVVQSVEKLCYDGATVEGRCLQEFGKGYEWIEE